jgi:hypothetical protein
VANARAGRKGEGLGVTGATLDACVPWPTGLGRPRSIAVRPSGDAIVGHPRTRGATAAPEGQAVPRRELVAWFWAFGPRIEEEQP